ncbi:MAG: FkbM family methyltransferase [Pseudorhodobacter sp.]
MKSLPLWKIRREAMRLWYQIKLFGIRSLGLKSSMMYAGLEIPLYREGMSAEVVMGIATGLYEKPEIDGLSRVLRPGDRVLELGAGLGVITAISSRIVGPKGAIMAYEANPKLLEDTKAFLLKHGVKNVELRGSVLVPQAAEGETREFHVSRVFAVSSLVVHAGSTRHKTISVKAQTANDVIADFAPDVLICDIEGGEAELIPAIDASRMRAVVIEMHPKRVSAEGLANVRQALEEQGLKQDPTPLGGTVELFVRSEPA